MTKPFIFDYRVSYADTDQMKVAYYSNYFIWFERARTEFFRNKGVSYKSLEQSGYNLPVAEATCKYVLSARYDDELLIYTFLDSIRHASICFSYEIKRKTDKKIIAIGYTKHPFTNNSGRPIKIPEKIKSLLLNDKNT